MRKLPVRPISTTWFQASWVNSSSDPGACCRAVFHQVIHLTEGGDGGVDQGFTVIRIANVEPVGSHCRGEIIRQLLGLVHPDVTDRHPSALIDQRPHHRLSDPAGTARHHRDPSVEA